MKPNCPWTALIPARPPAETQARCADRCRLIRAWIGSAAGVRPARWSRAGPGPHISANTSFDYISNVVITCRLIDRKKLLPSANEDMAFAVKDALNASSWFKDAKLWDMGVQADPTDTNTMTFEINVGLKHPFKL